MKQSFFVISITFLFFLIATTPVNAQENPWWNFQAIDTMKYSRDVSREFLSDPQRFEQMAEQHVKDIASTGATHVAIATPYDEEFMPVLKNWVAAARRHNLHVWFRGNWSGWEGWFGYPKITRQEHLEKTVVFIESHPELFKEGDYFSACPECENGGPGDPRMNGDAAGHRKFLIDEHDAVEEAFRQIGIGVRSNLNSMNGDVARLIMDKETTKALGGVVVVDHYVRTPEQLNKDVSDFARRSGGKVILGEFGAPIPDINGQMTQEQQAKWLNDTLALLATNPDLEGLSYWTNMGGSTAIWEDDGTPKLAVQTLTSYFTPKLLSGKVVNTIGKPIDAQVKTERKTSLSLGADGFELPYLSEEEVLNVTADGYVPQQVVIDDISTNGIITLEPLKTSLWYRFQLWLKGLFSR